MHFVYILYSSKCRRYYIGETPDVDLRLQIHNDTERNTNSTKNCLSWELYWTLEVKDRSLARKIEGHIKRMRNQKYYHDLKRYPEISQKLIQKYSEG
jgi:putative endonuclease